MLTNVTKTFDLTTKNLSFVATLATVPLIHKRLRVRNNFSSLTSAFLQSKEMQIVCLPFLKKN